MLAQRNQRLGLLFLGIAGLSLFLALALGTMDIEPRPQRGTAEPTLRNEPPVGMKTGFALGGLFFLYCGTESAIGGWAGTLAKRMGTSPGNFWELAPMFFWAGLLAGRAMAPMILRRTPEGTVLIIGLILAGVSNGALLWLAKFQGTAICLVGAGLGFAGIFPLLVASLVGHYGKRARRAASVIFALASLGGATIPWLVGFTSTHVNSLRAGLMVPLIACMFMLGLSRLLKQGGHA